jgi:CDP-glycerol glycerophosphotransferase
VPRISVVVPIYDVEAYLPACLRSLAAQTTRDLEIVMVDDGSTDASAEVAHGFAERDARFRLIRQANAGLGNARNTGVAAASGELLAFADSDDVVPPEAYEHLADSLDRTGSDFASGNVLRLTDERTSQSPFLAETFARTRPKTHVSRFRPLLADRTAWNKLFRRRFWDANDLRFPEGVLHEDIPVTLPAHVMAASVDVLAEPVYHWRIRGDGDSITQQRLELRALVDRLAAVEHVRAYLGEHGPRRLRRWYDQRLVRDDLRLHLDLLADAEPAYRALFVEHVTALFDGARPSLFADLPAIDRLKWHLVLRERTDDLIDVLRFEQQRRASTPPLRRRGRWYGDYPHQGDPEIPRSVFRLGKRDAELSLRAEVEELACEDDRLIVRGHAHLAGLAVAAPDDQRVQLLAVRRGRWQRLRMRAGGVRVTARPVARPDLAGGDLDRTWSGFEAELPPAALSGTGTWQLGLFVRAHGLRRRYLRFDHEQLAAAELPAPPGLAARAVACTSGRIEVRVRDRWAVVTAARIVDGDVLELTGEQRLGEATRLELRRAGDGWCTETPLTGDGAFVARLPLSQLHLAPREADAEVLWQLSAIDGGRRVAVALPDDAPLLRWRSSGRELALARTPAGDAAIADRDARPLVTAAGWAGAGRLALDLRLAAGLTDRELVLMDWHRDRAHAFPLLAAEDEGVFRVLVPAAELLRVPAGYTPRRGEWRFYGRPAGEDALTAMARVRLDAALLDALPLTATVEERLSTLQPAPDGSLLLSVPGRSAAPARARAGRGSARAGATAPVPAE